MDEQTSQINMDNTKALISLLGKTREYKNEILIDLDLLKQARGSGQSYYDSLVLTIKESQEFQKNTQHNEDDFITQKFTSLKDSIVKVECGLSTHSKGKGLDWAAKMLITDGLT